MKVENGFLKKNIYQKPNLSKANSEHKIYPWCLEFRC